MDCRDLVEVISKSGLQAIDRPVTATSLGLPDSARVRLLVELGGLLRVYCAETPGNLPSASRLRSNLEGTGYDSLALVTTDGQQFLSVYVAIGGEEAHKTLSATEVAGLLKNAALAGEVDAASASDRILELLTFEEEPKAYNNRGLFSDDYLEYRLPEGTEWAEDVSAAYEGFRELYEGKKNDLAGIDEANTEMEFVEPALTLLGFHPIKRAKTKTGSIPDYALFGSAEDKNVASKLKKDSEAFYARTLAVVEGKYWGRNLDVYTKKEDQRETEKQTSSPEMQVVRYLRDTDISWGLLTNGAEWRLYHGGPVGKAKKYYSVDFERALATEEDFKRFYLFFRREAFVPKGPESKSFLDGVLESSERYAIRVSDNLKDVVFTRVFPQLAKGFIEYHADERKEPVDDETLKKVYRNTLALLYRLLFLLYAEARDLLPTDDSLGYGARGINAIKEQVADRLDKQYTYTGGYVLWQSLKDLFRIMEAGDETLSVPPYNGGLFKDEGNHELLRTHRIADRHLASAIDALARQQDEGGENRFVDYGFVGVRELGSVYEGLLEFSLRIADENLVAVKKDKKEIYIPEGTQGRKNVVGRVKRGEPYLVNDKKERKASGSYYTPRYIVDYIVENTLRPLVAERSESLERKLQEIRRTDNSLEQSEESWMYRAERRREAGALEILLDIKVLDPAMGSGHFLVATVDYLTDEFSRLISELNAEPIIEQLAHLREEIEESLKPYGTKVGEEQLSDANLLKRMIIKRCVYGVDHNEMAVELAKLSLWLDAFTVGAPLSFLDHHLKHGNSLVGSSVRDAQRELEASGALTGTVFEGLLSGAEAIHELEEIPDATITQVRDSASLYATADEELNPIKRVMDVWTSKHFDNAFAETVLKDELTADNFVELANGHLSSFSERGIEVFQRAAALKETEVFFHWELEFPEVFYQGTTNRDDTGFDAVVGNPPYVRPHNIAPSNKKYFWAAYETFVKKSDLYCCFVERGLKLLRHGGAFGYIVSNGWLRLDSFEKLRLLLLRETAVDKVVEFLYDVFENAAVKTAILLLRRSPGPPNTIEVVSSDGPLDLSTLPYRRIDQELFRHTYKVIFDLSIDESLEIIKKKMRKCTHSLDCLFDLSFGLKTGDDAKFLSFERSSPKYKPLLRGENIHRYEFAFEGEYVYYDPQEMRAHRSTARPGTAERFEQPKVLVRDTGSGLQGTFDARDYYAKDVLILTESSKDAEKLQALAGVLNSRLMRFYYETSFPTLHVQRDELASLPIRTMKTNSKYEETQHQLASLVKQMLQLQEERAELKQTWREWVEAVLHQQHDLTEEFLREGWVEIGLRDGWDGVRAEFQNKEAIPTAKILQDLRRETEDALEKLKPLYKRIEETDHQIDSIVYSFYDLTDDEIVLVEERIVGA